VFYGRAGLLDHGVVGNGKVAAGVVAGEEDGDVVDGRGRVGGIGGEGHAAVGGDVEGDFHLVYMCVSQGAVEEQGRQHTTAQGRPGLRRIQDGKAGGVDLAIGNGKVEAELGEGGGQKQREQR
jgi:hypothetical protein